MPQPSGQSQGMGGNQIEIKTSVQTNNVSGSNVYGNVGGGQSQ